MDRLIKNLRELSELLKARDFVPPKVVPKALPQLPSIKQPKAPSLVPKKPSAPKIPGIKPGSTKDPKKMAEQLKHPSDRKAAIKEADMLKFDNNGQWKLDKADSKTYELGPEEHKATHDVFNVVHAKDDALSGGFAPKQEQEKLIHGLDFRTSKSLKDMGSKAGVTTGSSWLQTPNHPHHVLVKPASGFGGDEDKKMRNSVGPDSMNSTRREVLYHNLANDAFGMGNYVPTTSAFVKNGDEWSAQKMVGAHHGLIPREPGSTSGKLSLTDKYKQTLNHMHSTGDLHKLALMNNIMANQDRHSGNFMVDNKEPKLHMIDNGTAFDYGNVDPKTIPAYLEHASNELKLNNSKLHPEAKKWLNSIDEGKVKESMKAHGFDEKSRFTQGILTRIKALKGASGKSYKHVNDLLEQGRRSTGPDYQHEKKKAG
jgi:hypothetical protein